MSLPKTMKAYKCLGEKKAGVVERPLPKMRDDYILVKVSCVALNPTDWKHIDSIPKENATVGCDYSGTVVQVGSAVTKTFTPGSRIAGFTHGVNAVQPEDGAFAEYAIVKGDVQVTVPASIPDDEAATFGVAISTVGQGMYQRMGLPLPPANGNAPAPSSSSSSSSSSSDKEYVLVYGGSTATGLMALQFARLSGLVPVATCSPRNAELVKSYGAEETFDYSDAEACADKIRAFTGDKLMYAFDCISAGTSAQICAGALSSKEGAKYCSLLPIKMPREDVQSWYTLAYTIMGERFEFRGGKEFKASPEDHEYAVGFWRLADQLLERGKIRAPPIDKREGGLEGIEAGLDDFRAGKISARKLVYRV